MKEETETEETLHYREETLAGIQSMRTVSNKDDQSSVCASLDTHIDSTNSGATLTHQERVAKERKSNQKLVYRKKRPETQTLLVRKENEKVRK